MADDSKNYNLYARFFSRSGFWKKLTRVASEAGRKVVYAALVLYYAATSKSTPLKDRARIYGALGYFILPFDLIPDFTAFLGYTDDLTALLWALRTVADNITPEICEKAARKLLKWFPEHPAAIAGDEPAEQEEDIMALNRQLGLPVLTSPNKTDAPRLNPPDIPEK